MFHMADKNAGSDGIGTPEYVAYLLLMQIVQRTPSAEFDPTKPDEVLKMYVRCWQAAHGREVKASPPSPTA